MVTDVNSPLNVTPLPDRKLSLPGTAMTATGLTRHALHWQQTQQEAYARPVRTTNERPLPECTYHELSFVCYGFKLTMDRRQWVTGAAASVVAVTTAAEALASAASTHSAAGAIPDARTLFRKLRFRTDDGLIFWWLEGPKMGQVGATLTPIYTNSVGTIQRIRHSPDGSFEMASLELVLSLDLETGEPLESWKNPYTGETLPVRFNPLGPSVACFRPDNERIRPDKIGGAPIESSVNTHPPTIVGDDVFVLDESKARVFTPGREKPFEVNDLAVYHGSLANLSDPDVTFGEAKVFFAEVTGWQRWMNMGDRPGNLTSRLSGAKVRRYEDLPETWRSKLAQVAPQIAADPIAALDRAEVKFNR